MDILEPKITKEEYSKSKEIRKLLKEHKFNDLYKILPKEIAIMINRKYRVVDIEKK